MKKWILAGIFLTACLITSNEASAGWWDGWFGGGGGTGGGTSVPLDGGLSLLAAAGIGFTARKMIRNRKQQSIEE